MFYLLETPKKTESSTLSSKYVYESIEEAIEYFNSIENGRLPTKIHDFLSKELKTATELNVLSPDIVDILSKQLNIKIVNEVDDEFRGFKRNAFKWFDTPKKMFNMQTLKIAYKIIDSSQEDIILIDLLNSIDDMNTNINNRIMRIREWYSLHFPELNAVEDNMTYLSYLLKIQNKDKFNIEQSDIPNDIKYKINNSMGTGMFEDDIKKLVINAKSIINDMEFRNKRVELLKSRCKEHFPNLFGLVGEQLCSKLIRKAGSISKLSQFPSSTIQILGAEKAYNLAIKEKSNTPKYGMIFGSRFIANASDNVKGKAARILSNSIALCAKADAAGQSKDGSFGIRLKKKVEALIERSEDKPIKKQKEIVQKKRKIISVMDYDLNKDANKKAKIFKKD